MPSDDDDVVIVAVVVVAVVVVVVVVIVKFSRQKNKQKEWSIYRNFYQEKKKKYITKTKEKDYLNQDL